MNNYLKFAMQLYFSPTTVRMLANLKVLVIAVLLKTITRRRFSVIQWEALALLVLGVTVNQMKLSLGASGAGKPVGTLGGPPGPDGVASRRHLRRTAGGTWWTKRTPRCHRWR